MKRGFKTQCEIWSWPSVAPTGYLNHPDRTMKCHVVVDPIRSHVIRMMFEKAAYEKLSIRKLYGWLKNELKFTTRTGKALTLSNVQIILRNNFYMGLIEYPRKSGKWYAGKHEPIISQELFKRVQERLDSYSDLRKGNNKEFAFTRLMKCGMCKSGVTAEEKFKNLKDGTQKKYIYYGCTRFHDKNCKNTYLREEDLISQLLEIVDRIDINQVGMRGKLEKEIERYNDFRNSVLGMTEAEKIKQSKVDLRNYMKHILEKGSLTEKRELMQSFTSRLVMISKRVVLEEIN